MVYYSGGSRPSEEEGGGGVGGSVSQKNFFSPSGLILVKK